MSWGMGSSLVFTCWGVASWLGGCAMLVLGAREAARAGSCVDARGSAWFGVAVVRGCSLDGCLGWLYHPRARFWLWSVVGVELARCVWGFQGWCRRGGWGAEPAWCGNVPVSVSCGVSCPWVGEGSAVWSGGARLRGGLPAGGGGGHCAQVWSGWWLLVAGHRAVWGSPARSLGRPSGVFQYVGRA